MQKKKTQRKNSTYLWDNAATAVATNFSSFYVCQIYRLNCGGNISQSEYNLEIFMFLSTCALRHCGMRFARWERTKHSKKIIYEKLSICRWLAFCFVCTVLTSLTFRTDQNRKKYCRLDCIFCRKLSRPYFRWSNIVRKYFGTKKQSDFSRRRNLRTDLFKPVDDLATQKRDQLIVCVP